MGNSHASGTPTSSQHREPRLVHLDCDPGIDDALAIFYLAALHHAGEIELVGLTTTAGNVDVDTTARNAAYLLALCGLPEIPVAAGAPGPVAVDLVTTPETHGQWGLGYHRAPDTPGSGLGSPLGTGSETGPAHRGAQDAQELLAAAAARDAHLIVTGPLTNLADATASFASRTVMGGAINYRGNTTPTAEWNFWVDPHAAAHYFAAATPPGQPTTLCSLEVTEQFLIDPPRLNRLVDSLGRHPAAGILPEVLRFYFEFHQQQGEGYQAQIHDLLTCMVALDTVAYEYVDTTVAVEADSPLLRGTSVADLRGHWDRAPNTRLVTAVDIPAAHAELTRAAEILADSAAGH
ncbi:nucleoside hydrolase [Corynebacterium lizhenjunii]|uniref:Nucleoside hydrolase n=1 Tax=Corynebacterium lizhenjunii TaxID=2709394 RepID=A0A7T0PCY8_9CORY|nr:nucleoside hydrolase [Corynebacterium lizhenjunii]QPK80222.1 nucleoside hydrolase [Corynebacterium lizhenjunii]